MTIAPGYFRLIKVEERFYRARVKEMKWWCKFSRKLDVPLSSSRGEKVARRLKKVEGEVVEEEPVT